MQDLLRAARRVVKTFGAMQDYEGQGDRWDDEDNAALDALRKVVERHDKLPKSKKASKG